MQNASVQNTQEEQVSWMFYTDSNDDFPVNSVQDTKAKQKRVYFTGLVDILKPNILSHLHCLVFFLKAYPRIFSPILSWVVIHSKVNTW